MVKRNKQLPPPALLDPKWDLIKANALQARNLHIVVDVCYRDTTKEPLLAIYKNKCAYCERDRGTEVNVDHYRPKKTRNNKSNIHYNQPGYYWLPYEWSNLLPLCSKCNQYKSNKFPLIGWSEANRIDGHENPTGTADPNRILLAYLNNTENPFLLNPEFESLEFYEHFAFNENGTIAGRTDKAVETIAICNLNRRDLKRERRKAIFEYVKSIKEEIDIYVTDNVNNPNKNELLEHGLNQVFRKIKNNTQIDNVFSLLNLCIYKYFNDIILPNVGGKKSKALVRKAFTNFKNTHAL